MPTPRTARSSSRPHSKSKAKTAAAGKTKSKSPAPTTRGRTKAKRSRPAVPAEDLVDQYDAESRQMAKEAPEADHEVLSDEQDHGAQATNEAERGDDLAADGEADEGEDLETTSGRERSQGDAEHHGKRGSGSARKQPTHSKR